MVFILCKVYVNASVKATGSLSCNPSPQRNQNWYMPCVPDHAVGQSLGSHTTPGRSP